MFHSRLFIVTFFIDVFLKGHQLPQTIMQVVLYVISGSDLVWKIWVVQELSAGGPTLRDTVALPCVTGTRQSTVGTRQNLCHRWPTANRTWRQTWQQTQCLPWAKARAHGKPLTCVKRGTRQTKLKTDGASTSGRRWRSNFFFSFDYIFLAVF
jgi:hypothetical protein